MPYPPEHKDRTHARIVEKASRLFRRDGYAKTGVDALMSAAGLTRGGFYAHFRDKAALLIEALDRAFDESHDNLFAGRMSELSGPAWLSAAQERYLSDSHRESPALGCAVPSLGAEVSRAPLRVRRRFGMHVERMLSGITQRLGGGPDARRRAIVLLSSWAGAMLLSRAVGDPELADEITGSVRAHWQRAGRRSTKR
jgi:TetR/AcrR family transcriptional regulator, transcriptional repressor for nem operon